jgi:hypothetical protein
MMTDSRSSARRGEQDSKIASSAAARRSWTGVRSMPGNAFPCKPNKRQTAQLPRRLSCVELMPRHVEAPDGRFPRRREVSEPGFSARGRAGLFCAGPGPGGGEVSVASLASIIQLQQPWVRLLQPMEALAVWIGAQQRLQSVIRGIASVAYTQVTGRRSMSLC